MRILYAVHQFFPEGTACTERLTLNLSSGFKKAGHEVKVVTSSLLEHSSFYQRNDLLIRDYEYAGLPVTAFRPKKIVEELDIGLGQEHEVAFRDGLNHVGRVLSKKRKELLNLQGWQSRIKRIPRFIGLYCTSPVFKKVHSFAQELLNQKSFDLLHITHPLRVSPFIFAAIEKKIPYVITLTDYFIICYQYVLINKSDGICSGPDGGRQCLIQCPLPRGKDYFLKRWFAAKEILSRAALVTARSKFIADTIRKEFPEINIEVITHSINDKPRADRDKQYFSDSSVTFGFMGRLAPYKGVNLLIETFKKLKSQNCHLKIYGASFNHYYGEQIHKLVEGDKRIEFYRAFSFEADTANILNDIDVLCVPSFHHDIYPLVILKALAAGVPVIGSRRGSIPEIVKDKVNGFLFDPSKEGNLSEVMGKIVKDPTILNTLKKNIVPPKKVEDEVKEYEEVYRKVVIA